MPILFKRPVVRDKDNNAKGEKEVENDGLEILLSSLDLCNETDDDCNLSTLPEDLNIPLPAPLKLQHSSDLTIIGHCDGIICLKLFIGNVILCNPAMKEFKLIPKSFLLLPNDDFNLWPLYMELDAYTECVGFGYDPKGKDYKIVRFVIYNEAYSWLGAEVYTMESNSWREIMTLYDPHRIPYIVYSYPDLPIYFNGICYWHAIFSGGRKCIYSFDMGNELFHEIPLPDSPDICKEVWLAVWKGSIAVFIYQEVFEVPQSYDMWVMVDDSGDGKGSWMKYLIIEPVEGVKCPLLFWNGGELLMLTNDGRTVLYSIGTQKSKYHPIHFMRDVFSDQALIYVNSIASICGGDTLEDIYISAFYGKGKFQSNYRGEVDISKFLRQTTS